MRLGRLGAILIAISLAAGVAAQAGPPAATQPADGPAEILCGKSYFRWRAVTREVRCVDAGGATTRPAGGKPALSPNPLDAPPPANWVEPGFDDSAWPRVRLAAPGVIDNEGLFTPADPFRVCFRGRFEVPDPAAVRELVLGELRYQGGVIVYLNGREVARANVPKGGDGAAAADPYPDDVWLSGEGKVMPADKARLAKPVAQEYQQREANRWRKFGPTTLPADALKKGVNLLAVEIRRSDSHPRAWAEWKPIGLDFKDKTITLRATGGGITPNVSRPRGLHVWVEDVNDRIACREWADPCEPVGPVRIVGARNGTFGGIVVISSTAALKNPKVTVSDLAATRGGAKIAASAVEILHARLDGQGYGLTSWFDGLEPGLPAESPILQITAWQAKPIDDAAVLPVYLRLHVPKDAAPGDYRGTATVAVGDEQVIVPIELYVSSWIVPAPKDYRVYVGLYQSPPSVTMQYKTPMWSQAHWKLLEKSFAQLGRVGNKLLNVEVVDQTQFGNDEGIIYWIRKGDKTYDYDFTNFDRLVALAQKHFGTIDYVALQIWHSGGWDTRAADQQNTVTVVDPATGKHEHMQVPRFDNDEGKAFWKPLLAACRDHLAKVGLEKQMCIGILSDGTAPTEVFKMFDAIWPGGGPARWTRGLHSSCGTGPPYRADRGGGIVVLHEHCYGSPMFTVSDPIVGLNSFRGGPATAYFRFSGFETLCTVLGYRLLTDEALFLKKQGIGRIGFDFWPVLPGRRGGDEGGTLYNRFPQSSCAQRAPALYNLSWPGPEGAETTLRFEALVSGVQETEAMIAVSAALDTRAAELSKELADRCRSMLYDRLYVVETRPITSPRWATMCNHVNHLGWQDIARKTFDCAGESAAK